MKLTTLNEIIAAAKPYYEANKLTVYHTWKHVEKVIDAVCHLAQAAGLSWDDTCTLMIAAAWHDAVYIPGHAHNEDASAQALRNTAKKMYGSMTDSDMQMVHDAARLIEFTTPTIHGLIDLDAALLFNDEPRYKHLQILLDADLSSLAAPRMLFIENQRAILRENFVQSDELNRSYEFLNGMYLKRGCFFRTDSASNAWEEFAVLNVEYLAHSVHSK